NIIPSLSPLIHIFAYLYFPMGMNFPLGGVKRGEWVGWVKIRPAVEGIRKTYNLFRRAQKTYK
ncbi:hypothetical protein, partial [Agrobacterium tumefaciens]|uniref:hypothetical protein n=1 Tax=Agrobacterium tumefaciens TaxID=358 RepID=UPI001AD8F8C5